MRPGDLRARRARHVIAVVEARTPVAAVSSRAERVEEQRAQRVEVEGVLVVAARVEGPRA